MPSHEFANPVERLFAIGRFFENLTISVVGGTRTTAGDEYADIEHPALDALIESKAIGSSQRPAIGTRQLEDRLKSCGFPYEHCLYALWVYRNTRQDRIATHTPTRRVLWQALARRTEALYLLDVRVLVGIQQTYGTTSLYPDGPVAEVPRLTTTLLRRTQKSPVETLQKCGIDPELFWIVQQHFRTTAQRFPARFHMTSIVPVSMRGYRLPIQRRYERRHRHKRF